MLSKEDFDYYREFVYSDEFLLLVDKARRELIGELMAAYNQGIEDLVTFCHTGK